MTTLYNRVYVNTVTTGTGTITLGTAFSDAFLTDVEASVANSANLTFVIEEGDDFEISRGVYASAGRTLTRATVLQSKIGGTAGTSKMTLAGSATVRLVTVAEDLVYDGVANTSSAIGVGTVELGHASDTTLSRSATGVLAVEGVTVPVNSITNTHTAQQIELGHASDTTLARASSGNLSIEGNLVYRAGGTDVPEADGGTGASTFEVGFTNLADPAGGLNVPYNLGLAVSAASSILTIALKGADGNDPSATNPVLIPFQNVTGATGTPTWVSVTAANSIAINSTATLGVTSSTAFRIWIVAFNDGGTIRLGVKNCSNATTIFPLNDGDIASSTQEGDGADSAGVFYTDGAAVTSKAYRILGFAEWSASGLTAGTWTTTNLIRVRLFGPGVKKPGDIVQVVTTLTDASDTTTSATFVVTATTTTITPTSAANLIAVEANGVHYNGSGSTAADAQISRGTTAATNMIGSFGRSFSSGTVQISCSIRAYDKPNTASAQAYAVQQKRGTGSGTIQWGIGAVNELITATEIMG